jgi:signal transduction histidine kinase
MDLVRRLTLVAVMSVVAFTQACADQAISKRVLLVFQNDGYSPSALEFQQSVFTRLRDALGPKIDFYCDQLDSTRIPAFRERVLALVRSRYSEHGIDLVIFVGSVPTDILPGVPVIYVGNLPSEFDNHSSNRENSVAVWFKVDVRKTIAVARQLQPKAGNVIVISGSGVSDRVYLDQIRGQLRDLDIPVEYLADSTVDQLRTKVASLPRNTIVLPISYSRDRNGTSYFSHDVVELLAHASNAPVYSVSDTYIGTGVVGGYVVNFRKTGEVVADAALKILGGVPANRIKVPPEGTSAYIFDWRQLKRWKLPERRLPAGSLVEFEVPTVWEEYRWRIVAIVSLVIIQSLSIMTLLINRRSRRRAESSLRDMTGRLLESQDEERRRIARDLHDGTGQHLSGMALTIGQVLEDFPPGHERLQQLLQDSHTASRQALNEVRTVSFVLHPPILDGVGLVSAIQWYVDGLQKRTDVRINFDAPADLGHLAPEAERALFRMVQEGITNVLRHSGGTALRIALSSSPRAVSLVVQDNGHGLTAEQLSHLEGAATLGVGIAGMRERIRQLRGEFKVQSNADGTKVTATVPLEKKAYAPNHVGR